QAVKGGDYPFFTCAEFPEQIDHYAFDGDVVLIAGNNARGNFHVSRYQGKFNAYQRTYVLTAKHGYDIDYIYYALRLELKRLREKSQGSQTKFLTMPILTSISLGNLVETEQSTVSRVLKILDKKIALNNRINAELEAMAKTLYDYWFVQFDFPDANGKPYKTSGGKMVYNATLKREIPAGWNIKNLGDIAELYQPKTISGNDFIDDGEYLVYGANGIVGRFNKYNHEEPVVTITCRGNTCGNINVTRPYSWITGNAMVVKPKFNYISPYYIYNLLSISEVDKVITGSAQPQITRANLAPLKVVEPAEDITQKYSKSVDAFFKKHISILDENDNLLKLRDWLLPLLMNGQVTVK
ncbi:TPA: restriction endonuclease subunit S, partial [Escherichia coli]|nr:restriction endonuclease subunit S [Escherichia coli]EJB2964963.1 restriction endonuclease subunit S [Escherichia coli]